MAWIPASHFHSTSLGLLALALTAILPSALNWPFVSISPLISCYQNFALQPSMCSVLLTTPLRKPLSVCVCVCVCVFLLQLPKRQVVIFAKRNRRILQKLGHSAAFTGFLGSLLISPPAVSVVHLFHTLPGICTIRIYVGSLQRDWDLVSIF